MIVSCVYSLLNIPVTQFTNLFPSIHGLVLPIFIYHLLFLAQPNFLPSSTMDAHPLSGIWALSFMCPSARKAASPSSACITATLEVWDLVSFPPGSLSSLFFLNTPAWLESFHGSPQPAELPSGWSFTPLCCFLSSQNCLLFEGRDHALFISLFLVSREFHKMDE